MLDVLVDDVARRRWSLVMELSQRTVKTATTATTAIVLQLQTAALSSRAEADPQ